MSIAPSTSRGTAWSVTINNPTDSDEECINIARQKGWTVIGQLEKGTDTGTVHYQLMVKTPQLRCSAIKKVFPRGHIEFARNTKALEQYVNKDDTRVGELKEQSDAYPSLSKFWTLILDDDSDEALDRLMVLNKDQLLAYLDSRSAELIATGYHVETLAVNPQVRSAFYKFAPQLHRRCQLSLQPARQTDTTEDSVDLPINAPEVQASRSEGEEDDASWSEDSDSEEFSESEYQEV